MKHDLKIGLGLCAAAVVGLVWPVWLSVIVIVAQTPQGLWRALVGLGG